MFEFSIQLQTMVRLNVATCSETLDRQTQTHPA